MARQQKRTQERISQIKSTRGTPLPPPGVLLGVEDSIAAEKAKDPADVIPRYYKPMTTSKTSLSRERIRQIETIAMRKFKRELVERGLVRSDLIG
jgi:hypothetical protein